MPHSSPSAWILAAYYWSPHLALALLQGERVIEVRCRGLTKGRTSIATLAAHFQSLVRDYAPQSIVLPPGAALYAAAATTGCPIETLSLTSAKERLLGNSRTSNRDLFCHLTEEDPDLERLLVSSSGKRYVAQERSRGAIRLLPVALALAAQRPSPPDHQRADHVAEPPSAISST